MKLERNMTKEEWKLFNENKFIFSEREGRKLVEYLVENHPSKRFNVAKARVFVSYKKIFIDVNVESSDTPFKNFDSPDLPFERTGYSQKREMDIDPLMYDESTGGYRVTAFLPGVKEDDIKISVRGGMLNLSAGDYTTKFGVPKSIREVRKTYNNSVLDLRLF